MRIPSEEFQVLNFNLEFIPYFEGSICTYYRLQKNDILTMSNK
jgi:hypothetical protein